MMADYVSKMTVEKSCKYGEYGGSVLLSVFVRSFVCLLCVYVCECVCVCVCVCVGGGGGGEGGVLF